MVTADTVCDEVPPDAWLLAWAVMLMVCGVAVPPSVNITHACPAPRLGQPLAVSPMSAPPLAPLKVPANVPAVFGEALN
jgi:hypothetical protein